MVNLIGGCKKILDFKNLSSNFCSSVNLISYYESIILVDAAFLDTAETVMFCFSEWFFLLIDRVIRGFNSHYYFILPRSNSETIFMVFYRVNSACGMQNYYRESV